MEDDAVEDGDDLVEQSGMGEAHNHRRVEFDLDKLEYAAVAGMDTKGDDRRKVVVGSTLPDAVAFVVHYRRDTVGPS